MEPVIEIPCCGGENGEVGNPYLFLPLYDGDIGVRYDRTTKSEFITRKPFAVSDFTQNGLNLTIANSGLVPSDLVMIEYQIVYCTAPGHNAQDGFIPGQSYTIHAGEVTSNEIDSYQTIDFVPAKNTVIKQIKFPNIGYGVYNMYFRAKVSTVWHKSVPMEEWDFATDVTVIEAHLRVRP
ncbi:hypothetical protein IDJ77_03455 [Mucilaginibacter sp. ZT4R22]|uniref:Uncharacterized protein n=1 Tax=Mucilaginibacter pankratovii TaxID=2772110 RepID=A0ABR7WL07_9SPHI|nr:hypothetical protein [Mucilaginibacter pankratovii]MBD1362856.1 hypothetical protein [Mucilaginibacter pankratovii]